MSAAVRLRFSCLNFIKTYYFLILSCLPHLAENRRGLVAKKIISKFMYNANYVIAKFLWFQR